MILEEIKRLRLLIGCDVVATRDNGMEVHGILKSVPRPCPTHGCALACCHGGLHTHTISILRKGGSLFRANHWELKELREERTNQRDRAKSALRSGFMKSDRICPCGCGSIAGRWIVCRNFWRTLPEELRLIFRYQRSKATKEVLRLAREHAKKNSAGNQSGQAEPAI